MPEHPPLSRWIARAALAPLLVLASCGGGSEAPEDDAPEPSSAQPAPASSALPDEPAPEAAMPTAGSPSVRVEIRDDTPEAAVETWIAAIAAGDFESALAVLDPQSVGHAALTATRDGMERALADPANAALMDTIRAKWADEVAALAYEMTTLAGDSATFQFTAPFKPEPWDVTVGKTPDGWRVTPPDSGMPQG